MQNAKYNHYNFLSFWNCLRFIGSREIMHMLCALSFLTFDWFVSCESLLFKSIMLYTRIAVYGFICCLLGGTGLVLEYTISFCFDFARSVTQRLDFRETDKNVFWLLKGCSSSPKCEYDRPFSFNIVLLLSIAPINIIYSIEMQICFNCIYLGNSQTIKTGYIHIHQKSWKLIDFDISFYILALICKNQFNFDAFSAEFNEVVFHDVYTF